MTEVRHQSIRQRVLAAVGSLGTATSRAIVAETGLPAIGVHNAISNLATAGQLVAERLGGSKGNVWRLATEDERRQICQARVDKVATAAAWREENAMRVPGGRFVRLTDTRHNEPALLPGHQPERWSPSY